MYTLSSIAVSVSDSLYLYLYMYLYCFISVFVSRIIAADAVEKNVQVVELVQEKAAPKSWADAVGGDKIQSSLERSGSVTSWPIAAASDKLAAAAKVARDPSKPVGFEEVIQETLHRLDVSAPAKEMKKR